METKDIKTYKSFKDFTDSNSDYYIGLDIGVGSVGWAATDAEYNLIRYKNKKTWGSYLFTEANSAAERRTFRGQRRRLQRRRERILLLRNLFKDEIEKIDKEFFKRLDESFFFEEDKKLNNRSKYSLFNDEGFTDQHFAKLGLENKFGYNTPYHLRKYLKNNDCKDPRVLYMCLSHMIKYRGNFLYTTDASGSIDQGPIFNNFFDAIDKHYSNLSCKPREELNDEVIKQINTIFNDKSTNATVKTERLVATLFTDKKLSKPCKDIFKCIFGIKLDIKKIILNSCEYENDDEEDSEELVFSDEVLAIKDFTSEEFESSFLPILCKEFPEHSDLFNSMFQLYRFGIFNKTLAGYSNISDSMIAIYNKHSADKQELKLFLTDIVKDKTLHDEIFKVEGDENNYVSYINRHTVNKPGKKGTACKNEDFVKYLKSKFDKLSDEIKSTIEYQNIYAKLLNKDEVYMPLIVTNAMASVPYQLTKNEMEEILDRQTSNFPFLMNKDEYGTVKDKIISILTFKRPYFYGVYQHSKEDKNDNFWLVRREGYEQVKILPWNHDKVIDVRKTRNAFIENLIGECTYIKGEKVLPANSLYYTEYMALDELNAINYDGQRLTNKEKDVLIEKVYKVKKNIKAKDFADALNAAKDLNKKYLVKNFSKFRTSDNKIVKSFTTYLDFKSILGKDEFSSEDITLIENLVKDISCINDVKEREKLLIDEYSDKLNLEQIKRISKLNYSGFGKFSKAFLVNLFSSKDNDRNSILGLLRHGLSVFGNPMTLNEILNDERYDFISEIIIVNHETEMNENGEVKHRTLKSISYKNIDNVYASNPVKKSVWKAVKIVKEIITRLKKYPKKIFIEVTRESGLGMTEKKKQTYIEKTEERAKKIVNLFEEELKECKKDNNKTKEIEDLISLLNENKSDILSKRVYLYFAQHGKCMYTGEHIPFKEVLSTNSQYDIDHIVPQSIIKDDSLDNLVLVKKVVNINKTNIYPLNHEIQHKQYDFWTYLKNHKFISNKKYLKLIRTTELTDSEIYDFINSQLVSTSQSNKILKDKLIEFLSLDYSTTNKIENPRNTIVTFSKAGFVSGFRKEYDIPKLRDLNNNHHAVDAYLNIVVGNLYYTKYISHHSLEEAKSKDGKYFSNSFIFVSPINGAWPIDKKVREEEHERVSNEKGENVPIYKLPLESKLKFITYLPKIKKLCQLNDMNIVVEPRVGTSKGGGLFDQSIYARVCDLAQYPLKTKDKRLLNTARYGGYNKVSSALCALVKITTNKGSSYKMIFLPLHIFDKSKFRIDKMKKTLPIVKKYLDTQIKDQYEIIRYPVKIKDKFKTKDGIFYLCGKGDNGKKCSINISNKASQFPNNLTKEVKYLLELLVKIDSKKEDIKFELLNKIIEKHNKRILKDNLDLPIIDFNYLTNIINQINDFLFNNTSNKFFNRIYEMIHNYKFDNSITLYQLICFIRDLIKYYNSAATIDMTLLKESKNFNNKAISSTFEEQPEFLSSSLTGLFE